MTPPWQGIVRRSGVGRVQSSVRPVDAAVKDCRGWWVGEQGANLKFRLLRLGRPTSSPRTPWWGGSRPRKSLRRPRHRSCCAHLAFHDRDYRFRWFAQRPLARYPSGETEIGATLGGRSGPRISARSPRHLFDAPNINRCALLTERKLSDPAFHTDCFPFEEAPNVSS